MRIALARREATYRRALAFVKRRKDAYRMELGAGAAHQWLRRTMSLVISGRGAVARQIPVARWVSTCGDVFSLTVCQLWRRFQSHVARGRERPSLHCSVVFPGTLTRRLRIVTMDKWPFRVVDTTTATNFTAGRVVLTKPDASSAVTALATILGREPSRRALKSCQPATVRVRSGRVIGPLCFKTCRTAASRA